MSRRKPSAPSDVAPLTERSSDALALLSPTGIVLAAGRSAPQLLGYTADEFVGQNAFDLIHPDDRPMSANLLRGLLNRPGASVTHQYRARHKDGTWRWMLGTGTNLLHRPGVHAIVVNYRDVTGSPAAEAAAGSVSARFQLLLEHGPDLFYRYRVLPPRGFEYVSPSAIRIIGYTPAEHYADPDLAYKRVHPEDRPLFESLLHPGAPFERPVLLRWHHRDGRWIWTEHRAVPLYDPDGALLAIEAVARDVTDRQEAEAALRRSEAQYRAVFEQATLGIYRSSAAGEFLAVNPALVHLLGYASADELLSVDLARDLYAHPEERAALIEQHAGAARIAGVEVEWRKRDGSPILVRLSGAPVHAADGTLDGFQMIVEDVTERRQLEAQLRQAQKMEAVGQLTAGLAHDFNNLLTIILSHADFVGRALRPDQAELEADLEELRRAAHRGAEMVHKLAAYSRQEKLSLRPLDLRQLVEETVATLRRVLPTTIAIELTAEPAAYGTEGDAGALTQILFNLATNARDAMPDGGMLRFGLARRHLTEEDRALYPWVTPGEYLCLTVADTGAGMDQGTLARVFEPFFTTKGPEQGTGLGLSMVYGLVKQHGGHIHFYSEPGAGTTVRIYLPVTSQEAAERGATAAPVDRPRGSETLLVVEDEPTIRAAARRVLEKHGYRVLAAEDGAAALELLRRHGATVALVITDVVMPRLDGRRLYETLRDAGNPVRVLFMSGYTARDFRERADLDPRLPFLSKPWTIEELLREVRRALDGPAEA